MTNHKQNIWLTVSELQQTAHKNNNDKQQFSLYISDSFHSFTTDLKYSLHVRQDVFIYDYLDA